MSVAFKDSETCINLMRAFAGESQARNRYTFAASLAKQQKLHVVEAVFQFTADQEKEHAEVFLNHLQEMSGKTIQMDGGFPVDLSKHMAELLRMAQHNEEEEHGVVYPAFGDKAKEEGFSAVAASFHGIALIEQSHSKRFAYLAEALEAGTLFVSAASCGWMCLNCGHIHQGTEAPKTCPICSHDQGYFIRLELCEKFAQ